MEVLLQQAEVRLRSHRHLGGHLASFQSGYHSGYHQQSDYASLDEPSGDRPHDLGYQDHDLWRQEGWEEVAKTKPVCVTVPSVYTSGFYQNIFTRESFGGSKIQKFFEKRRDMTTTATRPVRIYLAMKDSPLPKAIKQVLPGGESHVYVESHAEADLVIFGEVRDIEQEYHKEKSYVCITVYPESNFNLPDNCTILRIPTMLVDLIRVIDKVRQEIKPIEETLAAPTVEVQLRADAKRILVIDDTPQHIESAKTGLAGHKLTTVTGYQSAMEILSKEKFDIVLTDLHLPMSSKTMGSKFKLGELVPYGVLLMIEAARQGAKHVAVVTDLGHHDDPFSAAFDHYSRFPVIIEGAKVMMLHARLTADGSKDWAEALDRLLAS